MFIPKSVLYVLDDSGFLTDIEMDALCITADLENCFPQISVFNTAVKSLSHGFYCMSMIYKINDLN